MASGAAHRFRNRRASSQPHMAGRPATLEDENARYGMGAKIEALKQVIIVCNGGEDPESQPGSAGVERTLE